MAVRIIVDSASDITPAEAVALGLKHVPLKVNFDGTEYRDGVDINHREFFEKLIESDVLPKTSQASPADYMKAIEEVVKTGDKALVIALSSALSGSYQSACIAAAEFGDNVVVVDSETVTIAQRLLVMRALELAKTMDDPKAIADILNVEKKNCCVLAVLDTLEYLKKGGRISAAAAFAGGILSLKPVVTVQDGLVICIGKARGSKNGNNLLRKLVEEKGGIDFTKPYGVAYSGISDEFLKKYIEDSRDLWSGHTDSLPVHTIGSVIGTHVGPGAIAVAFFKK